MDVLYQCVIDALGGHAGLRVVDAYAGIGVLACHLAVDAREVVCIESNRGAAQLGVLNARVNDVDDRMHYVLSPVEDALPARGRRRDGRPWSSSTRRGRAARAGSPGGWRWRGRSASSTSPATRRRSRATSTSLVASGPYRVDALDIVDMFPQTYHVESVVTLIRADARRGRRRSLRHPLSGTLRARGGGSPRSGSVRLFAVSRPQPGGRVQGTSATGEEIETGGFVHLHTHSEFSLLDGASRINELVDTRQGDGPDRDRDHRPRRALRSGRFLLDGARREDQPDPRLRDVHGAALAHTIARGARTATRTI